MRGLLVAKARHKSLDDDSAIREFRHICMHVHTLKCACASTATVDEHLQKEGAETFGKFYRWASQSVFPYAMTKAHHRALWAVV